MKCLIASDIHGCLGSVKRLIDINPGSVSIPKGASQKSFMILNGKKLQWRHLDDNQVYKEIEI